MLKSSALGIAIIIALLTGLISGAFILNNHLHRLSAQHMETKERLIDNCASGLEYLLSGQQRIKPDSYEIIDLFNEGKDSVLLKRKTWGGYEIIFSSAFSKGKTIYKTAVTGTVLKKDSARTALYICDFDRPVSLCGNTRIEGTAYIPAAGFKRAYIEGQNYSGDKFLYGQQLLSKRELPEFNTQLLASNINYLSGKFHPDDSLVNFSSIQTDSINHSFKNRTLVIEGIHNTNNLFLSQNIILYSSGKIFIAKNSRLNNIIIYANEIEIEKGFTGNLQAFAGKQVKTGKAVVLSYPSVVGVIEMKPFVAGKDEKKEANIIIEENSTVSGAVFALQKKKDPYLVPRVELNNNVSITGDVYVDGELDLKGNVWGSVYCQRFMLKTPSSVYENHILNTEINANKIPAYFSGINLFKNERKKVIVKWLS